MNSSIKICILVGSAPSYSARAEGTTLSSNERFKIYSALENVGLTKAEIYVTKVSPNLAFELNSIPSLNMIIAMGEEALAATTYKRGIDKWQLSPLDSLSPFSCDKVIPTFDFRRLHIQYDHHLFFYKAFVKAAAHLYFGPWKRKATSFDLQTIPRAEHLEEYLKGEPIVSVDIETSRGTINTMGFATSANNAVAYKCEPGSIEPGAELAFWKVVAKYMENPGVKKILQNNIYEATYFSRYGINLVNVWHDTMWAQKLLYPEFKQGLDTVGRLFTNEIYWKEDGKDWTKIDNWRNHMIYNCKDTTNTYEAAMNQRLELAERGLLDFYEDYLNKLAQPLKEMCCTGLHVDYQLKDATEALVRAEIKELVKGISKPINYRSPKQKMMLFADKGYQIPKKRNTKGMFTPSVDELSMKKMRVVHPEDTDIDIFLKLAKLEKFLGSYIEFSSHTDGRVRYTIKGTGTETLRFSSGTDSWGLGFNAQTIPKKAKKFFIPPPNHTFVQIDLKQAESRYVAYKTGDKDLIRMLEDPAEDLHSYVAAEIFGCSQEQILAEKAAGDPTKRQLGKRSNHGATYAMRGKTFQESCLKEDLMITKKEADHILDTFHALFPGIREWHKTVQQKLKQDQWLENPLGFRRYFYGRLDDSTFREAYAFEPQSTIPAITNHLMLYLLNARDRNEVKFQFHLQVHDSLVLSATKEELPKLYAIANNLKLWHPKITFPAGELWIPVDFEVGPNLADLQEYES